MSGESVPPASHPPAVRAALSQLGDVLESLRERLGEDPSAAARETGRREALAERDEHALAIFQEILSVPPLGLPPGEMFGLAMDRLSRLLAADRALLFVLDEASGRLVARSGRGVRREDMEAVSLDPREGLVGRVFKEKRVLTFDAAAEPATGDPFVERFPVRQAIAVPVRTEGEVGGVLFAGRQALGAPFTTTDVLLLLVIADRVGSALVYQRLLERQGGHLLRLRELRTLVDGNLAGREPGEILARACDAACRLLGVRGALAVAGAGPGEIDALAGAGRLAAVGRERLGAGDASIAEGFAADTPIAIRDLQARPGARSGILEQEGLRSALLVPMRVAGRGVGLLCLADPDSRDFSADEVESALMLAALTGAALETHRALHELRRALAERGAGDAGRAELDKARVLAAFAAGFTRELSSVFATLLGKSQLLLARAQGDPLREGLTELEEAAWRGTDLIQRLLGLAAVDQAGVARVDLAAIAQEAMAFTRGRADQPSGGRIEMGADLGSTPPVEASAPALRDVVVNLVVNAIEAMPEGGTVTVRTRAHDDGAELLVSDTGPGIPAEVRPRIFDPFFTTRPGHVGLGLCIARAIVVHAGGRIDVQSGSGGTTVAVWLPAAPARLEASAAGAPALEPARPAPTAPPPAERTGSVLVVEEEEGIRTAVMDALMAVGHRVEAVEDATAALERVAQGGIEVVVTDLALRDRSGLQLASALKERSGHTAVVLLTGWGRRLHEDRVRESGVAVMLVKPVQPDRVRSAVAEALRLRRPA
jgi:signal transduction histidine kinase